MKNNLLRAGLPSLKNPLFIVLLLALFYRVLTAADVSLGGYDEHAYGIYVNTLGEKGIEGIRSLARQFPDDGFLSKAPSPLRILFIFIGMLSCKLLGGYKLVNLAVISFFSGLGTIAFGILLFRKWFSVKVAVLGSLLLIASPLATGLSRRALQDSFFAFIVIMIIFFYDRSWQRQKSINLFVLGAFLLAAFLTKESIFFLYPCFALAAVYYKMKMPKVQLFKIAMPFLIAPVLYLLITVWLAGGPTNYLRVYSTFVKVAAGNDYPMRFQQGPWFRYIIDFMLVSPLTYLFSIVGMVSVLRNKCGQDGKDMCIIYTLSGLFIFTSLNIAMPTFNMRWLLFLDVPLRALAALGIIFVADKIDKPLHRHIAIACLAVLVLGIDIYQFFKIFVQSWVYDPVTAALIEANGFIK